VKYFSKLLNPPQVPRKIYGRKRGLQMVREIQRELDSFNFEVKLSVLEELKNGLTFDEDYDILPL